jgi:hypothetical protein
VKKMMAALGVAVLLGTATPAYAARDDNDKKKCGREYSCNKNGHRGDNNFVPRLENSPVTICIGPNSCPGKDEKPS